MSQVWKARCKTFDEVVAVKLMDLEAVNCSLVRARIALTAELPRNMQGEEMLIVMHTLLLSARIPLTRIQFL